MVGAVVWVQGLKLARVSAYIRHTTSEGAEELTRALHRTSETSDFSLICTDYNGHSPLWGPQRTKADRVGSLVEGVLSESGLLMLNSADSPATFRSDAGQET